MKCINKNHTIRDILLRLILVVFSFIAINTNAIAKEKDLIDLAISHNKNGEYYNSITEIMRYQYIYPTGKFYPLSMLIISEAYYKGGNFNKAINILTECNEKFRNTPEGEKALLKNGRVKLAMSSPHFAYRTYKEYEYIYPEGKHKEDIMRDLCFTFTLMKDLRSAGEAVKKYEDRYSDGKYLEEIKELQHLIDDEINRPKKNVWISVLGSIFIPGFGHFYTGKYEVGFLSFISNAALIYCFYDGYRDRSKVRMLVFGLAEFSFYQYSLYSSITNVYDYNNNEAFYKTIRLKAIKEF